MSEYLPYALVATAAATAVFFAAMRIQKWAKARSRRKRWKHPKTPLVIRMFGTMGESEG